MQTERFEYRLVRLALPPPAESAAPATHGMDVPPPTPWWEASCVGGVLRLTIKGRIKHHPALGSLMASFTGAKACEISIENCSGGDSAISLGLCLALHETVGRQNVRTRVRGFCNSAATDFCLFSQNVVALHDARFLLHTPTLGLQGDCQLPIATAVETLRQSCEAYADMLRMRIPEASRFMDGRDHLLDSLAARGAGLIDEVDYGLVDYHAEYEAAQARFEELFLKPKTKMKGIN